MQELHDNKIILLSKFNDFIKTDIQAALGELKDIKTEKNRFHLQKLVYIDLVNRFDSLIDSMLLAFATEDGMFRERILKNWKEIPVYKQEMYEVLMSINVKEYLGQKMSEAVKAEYLSKRHSDKLRILLKTCFAWEDTELQRPRVDSNGSIGRIRRRLGRKNPTQVPGFADWLYSRRNALVHGDKNHFIQQDREIIEQKFQVLVPLSIVIKLSSITTAARFYSDLCKLMQRKIDNVIIA